MKKKSSNKKGGALVNVLFDELKKLIVPVSFAVAAKHLSKKNKHRGGMKKKTKSKQKGGFIRGGSVQHLYNGKNCNSILK